MQLFYQYPLRRKFDARFKLIYTIVSFEIVLILQEKACTLYLSNLQLWYTVIVIVKFHLTLQKF